MCPGACPIAYAGREAITAACGVTPQPQKTGTSPGCTGTASPKSGCIEVGDADRRGITDVHRSTVDRGVARGHADRGGTSSAGTGRIETTSGPCSEPAGRVSTEVRYIGTFEPVLEVAHRDAGLQQRGLEGEAAAEQERDQVLAPVLAHVGHLGDRLAVLVDDVRRQVGAQVAGEDRCRDLTGLGDVEHRARLRVALREEQHVVCQVDAAPRAGWPGSSPRTSPTSAPADPPRNRARASAGVSARVARSPDQVHQRR